MVTDLVLGPNEEVIGVETYFGSCFGAKAGNPHYRNFSRGADLDWQ